MKVWSLEKVFMETFLSFSLPLFLPSFRPWVFLNIMIALVFT